MDKSQFLSFWRLDTEEHGRQQWRFLPPQPYSKFNDLGWRSEEGKAFLEQMSAAFTTTKKDSTNSADHVYRAQKQNDLQPSKPASGDKIFDTAYSAINYYTSLQAPSGHWPGDYGGPLFLAPGLIIASYVTGSALPASHCALMKQYFLNHQNDDGGWGLHIEAPSTMFGTVLQYVSLRLLGMSANDPAIEKAKKWIHQNGGATGIPSWGKFYLSVLGAYDWNGVNSLLPEMWLMPGWMPVHPSRYWCHARMVYLPMSYCYANRVTGERTELVKELRRELYTEQYEKIDWNKARNVCAATDLYHPPSTLLKVLNGALNVYEMTPLSSLRKKAIAFTLDYVNAEDEQTNYIDIGPVNQVINSIVTWHAYGKNSKQFKMHVLRWEDYLWVAEDGMKMNGYNGSQLWDTVFAAQAILEGGFEKHFPNAMNKAHQFIDVSQIKEEVRDHEKYFRHASVGGWPFSNVEHGWPITDCTAEGLKTALLLNEKLTGGTVSISAERLQRSVDLILSLQNKNGSWASYELTRGPNWLEALNPSEIFGNIMIDHAYTECSSACIQALIQFSKNYPDYKKTEVERSVAKGIDFILSQQRADGSWYGSWAVCFTYGTWFGAEALAAVLRSGMVPAKAAEIKKVMSKACAFLLSKQNEDGGWGENFASCITKEYVANRTSQIINTSWALLALMAMECTDKKAIEKGITLLQQRQLPNGDMPQESISGVFNHNCAISYTSYRNVFPIWALGRYLKKYNA